MEVPPPWQLSATRSCVHQVALSWRGGETGMEGPGVVEERAEEGGASTFMQHFEFQTTGVCTLREVLPSKANSSSL